MQPRRTSSSAGSNDTEEEELPLCKLGNGLATKRSIEATRLAFIARHKPPEKHMPCLKVRITELHDPSTTCVVEVANLPPDQLSDWVLRELSACHPEYPFWTSEGERVAISRITTVIGFGKGDERPFEPVQGLDRRGPFLPIRVRLRGGRSEQVAMANIPATEAGFRLVKRLMSSDSERERQLYRSYDFLTTECGWMPIASIDENAAPFGDGSALLKKQVAGCTGEQIADGNYGDVPPPEALSRKEILLARAQVKNHKKMRIHRKR